MHAVRFMESHVQKEETQDFTTTHFRVVLKSNYILLTSSVDP